MLEIDGRDFFLEQQTKSLKKEKPKNKEEALAQEETYERVFNKVKSHYHVKPAILMTAQCTIKKKFCESSNLIMYAMLK